ncbi:MAG: ABC transporter ATP-binding protein [Candidatus Aminicenantes bacterium]|nr:ABC transporter ATP-binding protein [Candidatus Aminicenantes bacterium]
MTSNDPVIQIRGLDFAYEKGWPALERIDLTVDRGERVALLGPNGAGKSTLLLHLNGILRGQGEIRVLGLPPERGHLKEIRARVGLVFQDPRQQLFLPRLVEDIAFGPLNAGWPPEEAHRRVERIMERFGLQALADRSPLRLSPGEQKRAALAAVLVLNPEVLAFDEPSSGLDPAGRRDFIALVKPLPQTQVIATHDVDLAWELCRRIVIMDRGRVCADGPRDVILGDGELLRAHRLEMPLSMTQTKKRR